MQKYLQDGRDLQYLYNLDKHYISKVDTCMNKIHYDRFSEEK